MTAPSWAGRAASVTTISRDSAAGQRWSPLVVVCASVPWDGPWMTDHHIAAGLSRHLSVLYVDPPISRLTRLHHPRAGAAWDEPSLRVLRPGLAVLRPHVLPLKERPGMKAVSLAVTRRAMRRAVAALGAPEIAAVVVLSLDPLLDALGPARKVFYATDDFTAGAGLMGLSAPRVRRWERRQLARADLVVAASPALARRYGVSRPTVVVPNGCDSVALAAAEDAPWPDQLAVRSPVAGFLGLLSDRVDVALLEAVADRGVSLLLVGGRSANRDAGRFASLLARPQVTWVGHQPAERLGSYLRAMDVGLLPYADTAFNRASFPLKILEYLGAGRRVVSTDLPAVQWLGTDLVRTARDPKGFADAVADELARPLDSGERQSRLAFAADHDWSRRVESLLGALDLPVNPSLDTNGAAGSALEAR